MQQTSRPRTLTGPWPDDVQDKTVWITVDSAADAECRDKVQIVKEINRAIAVAIAISVYWIVQTDPHSTSLVERLSG